MIILQKSTERDLVILNISDPQMSASEWECGTVTERMIRRTVSELIQRVKPDLITVTGDLGYPDEDESYERLSSFLDSFGIPWAPVMGNHDNQNGDDRAKEIADVMMRHSSCMLESGPSELGVGNYVIRICEGDSPVTSLILMDTHNSFRYENGDGRSVFSWGEITKAQEEWYREVIEAEKDAGSVDAALIIHVPLYNYREAVAAAYKDSFDPDSIMPFELDKSQLCDGYKDTFGVNLEDVSSPSRDCGFFDTVCESGITRHVLCGHNHINNSSILYRGVRLSYSCKTGCGSYFDPRVNGGTVLKVGARGIFDIHHEYVDVSDMWDQNNT